MPDEEFLKYVVSLSHQMFGEKMHIHVTPLENKVSAEFKKKIIPQDKWATYGYM